ncbi:MAG: hypothetical protein JJU46_08240, partial [Balneolaceae bacterium]|nr:hypothetical protein [Balneolaceae bacterium]
KGGNRIRALSACLVESGLVNADELPEGLTMEELIRRVKGQMNRLAVRARKLAKDRSADPAERARVLTTLENCTELYRMAYDGYSESARRHKELKQASKRWEKVLNDANGSPGRLRVGSGKKGIRIKESVIALDDEAKLRVCRHLSWFFQKEDIKHYSHSLFSSFDNRGGMSARRLAIEIALALEPHTGLLKPEIQRNVNATKAVYLGGLSPDLSAIQKKELGEKMVKEVDNGLGIAAIRMTDTMVHQYGVELSEEAIDFLRTEYKAGRRSLERVINREKDELPRALNNKENPATLSEPASGWKKSLQELKKATSKN